MRELVEMAEARMRDTWGRASSVMALLANCHRDAKKHRAFRPADFDPFAQRDTKPLGMREIKRAFEGKTE